MYWWKSTWLPCALLLSEFYSHEIASYCWGHWRHSRWAWWCILIFQTPSLELHSHCDRLPDERVRSRAPKTLRLPRPAMFESLSRDINLPWFIYFHAVAVTLLGFSMVLRPRPADRASEISVMLGLTTAAIGTIYLATAYMPMHENAWLYASVPVRMFYGTLGGIKYALSRHRMSKDARNEFLGLLIYDGLGGLHLGYWLGTWSGKLPGYWAEARLRRHLHMILVIATS